MKAGDAMTETMTDTEWEELLSSSPKTAFEALYSSFGGLVYAIAANKLSGVGCQADIEDCVGDVFAEIFRSAGRFSGSCGSIKTFVSTIARRRAIDCYRRLTRNSLRNESIEDEAILPPAYDDTEEDAEERIMKQRLWAAVKSLGEPDTSIIVYQYFYGLSVSDTAVKVGMTPAAVQKRSVRARAKMKNILLREDRE